MNIVIIPSWYHTQQNPTLGSFFKEQAEALAKHGHDVTVLYCDVYGVKYFNRFLSNREKSNYVENGVRVYRTKKIKPLKSGSPGVCKAFTTGILELFAKHLAGIKKVDIIHAHSSVWAGYAAMRIKEKYNIPYVITEHFTGFSRQIIKQEEVHLIKDGIKHADKIIAVSQGLKSDLSPYASGKEIEVIPNMVDVNKFKISQKVSNKSKFCFLTVCYLMHKKGIDILLKSFAKAFKENYSVELLIGGDGEEKLNLINLAKSLGIQDQVKFLGSLSRTEVIENMQNCDAFVLPSRFETFGVVFIEALACGKPIIASRTGGPDTIVNEKNGLLVEVEDINGLALAMNQLVNNYEKYNAEEIRKDCVERFSEEAIIDRLDKIYNNLIQKQKI